MHVAGTPQAYKLMMEGSSALADAEANGIRIDVEYLDRAIEWAGAKVSQLTDELRSDDIYKLWRKLYGARANLGSRPQLARVLFDELGEQCEERTATGRPKADEEALEAVDLPFVRKWLSRAKLEKCLATNLIGIRNEVDNGFLHPVFNLHIARTYRSSSDSINFQNLPNRDARLAKLVRSAFVPRTSDHVIMEADFGALEFRVAASVWNDPKMISYASDPVLDIHRDMAMRCYSLQQDQVTKAARGVAKNAFVFPILYGSYYVSCARDLWAHIGRHSLITSDGVTLYDHLASRGITNQSQFELHIKRAEAWFNRAFPTWSRAKDDWQAQYNRKGWFPLKTGFVCQGIYTRNNIMNYPVQGPAFHLLLWSLIQVNAWLKSNNMRTVVLGQIHDSIVLDVHRAELDLVVPKVNEIMTQDVVSHWDWIKTPMEVELEIAETTWFDKKPFSLN